ncbi:MULTISPECIES: hypothetical protein [unclassified Novosphingobium]|uniref:hypothetical protein n=1 Tax=unclassified Novosphingobium TaxID=2644732 RepID=UPI000AE7B3E9|nr:MULTISPECIES: hypothetical protein [unclassified Novosphingobium]MBN9145697.1 hypothetical protein [Novosphingobium sp.]
MNTVDDPPYKPHQRIGVISNAHAGRDFECSVQAFLSGQGVHLEHNFSVPVGHVHKKGHRFDLGGASPPILVECKSYNWTETGNSPSAKLRSLNEAMLYFMLAPTHYRKLLVMQTSKHSNRQESLGAYYVRTQGHLIPPDVEVWELNPESMEGLLLSDSVAPRSDEMARPPADAGGANDMPGTQDFVDAIRARLRQAELGNAGHLDINSGELHRSLGGYPGPKAAMPSCCNAMYAEQRASDQIISQPPKGRGASLTIRYFLPR